MTTLGISSNTWQHRS